MRRTTYWCLKTGREIISLENRRDVMLHVSRAHWEFMLINGGITCWQFAGMISTLGDVKHHVSTKTLVYIDGLHGGRHKYCVSYEKLRGNLGGFYLISQNSVNMFIQNNAVFDNAVFQYAFFCKPGFFQHPH